MPMPADEAERVKALHRDKVLDISPEKVYDNLTRPAIFPVSAGLSSSASE
jgi:hypothetical protein